ncbi:hypothetical protein NLI96_g13345 [Meripilus lineatus]|uniref:Uncharacterized protein n=1 Tax=Meripilus lineatus TaxID=2056292 RepID=A0AAD5UPM6_9APHY|nr:hypothetical protein NLI96_g13345 [Physisporinus lineatus]
MPDSNASCIRLEREPSLRRSTIVTLGTRMSNPHERGGGSAARVTLPPDSNTNTKQIDCDPRQPIPVIFIPGVMGSLLLDRNNGNEIWNPPNSVSGSLSFAASGYFANAAERQTRYDPDAAVVSTFGEITTKGCDVSEKRHGAGAGAPCTAQATTQP